MGTVVRPPTTPFTPRREVIGNLRRPLARSRPIGSQSGESGSIRCRLWGRMSADSEAMKGH